MSEHAQAELVAALQRLADEAEASLDYRPEFRRAIADAYVVIRYATTPEIA